MISVRYDGKSLVSAGRDISVPFVLSISLEGVIRDYCISRLFRVLPGKRLVALAQPSADNADRLPEEGIPSNGISEQKIILKIFLGRTAEKYSAKELEGIQSIERLGIKKPEFLGRGFLGDGSGRVLAFQYLDECENLEDVWFKSLDRKYKLYLLEKCMEIFARMHDAGVRQKDIHLNNFVIQDNSVYAIDGGGMDLHKEGNGLSRTSSLENLARFFAQFKPSNDWVIEKAVACYASERKWPDIHSVTEELYKTTLDQRQARKKHYLLKTLRECSRFVCRKNIREYMVCERKFHTPDLMKILSDPDEVIIKARKEGRILKDGNSATIVMVEIGEQKLVLKRYNSKSLLRMLRQSLRISRARNSWINAHLLEFIGVTSVRPVAMMEKRWGPVVTRAYFVSEYINGINLDEKVSCIYGENPANNPLNDLVIEKVVSVLKGLKNSMIVHGDLKATNFRISNADIVLLDLDSMKDYQDEKIFSKAYRKDIDRFMQNWIVQPELQSRFLKLTESLIRN